MRVSSETARATADRLTSGGADLIVICAPAGYGKSTLAQALAARDPHSAACDARSEGVHFAAAIADALELEQPGRTTFIRQSRSTVDPDDADTMRALALELWQRAPDGRSTFVLENAEALSGRPGDLRLLAELIATRPPDRRIVICSRVPLPEETLRGSLPHRRELVRAADLRLSVDDIEGLLRAANADPAWANEIERISEGWPIAVLLLIRFAREERLGTLAKQLQDISFDSVLDYLAREYVSSLPDAQLDALLAAAAVPRATVAELETWFAPADGLARFLRECPFVRTGPDDIVHVHPLLAALFQMRYAGRLEAAWRAALRSCEGNGAFLRAAELARDRSDYEAAAGFLARLSPWYEYEDFGRLVDIVAHLSVEQILLQPTLWLATLEARRCSLQGERLLEESRRVYGALPPTANESLRTDVTIKYCTLLINYGRAREVESIVDDALDFVHSPDLQAKLRLMQAAAGTMRGQYLEAKRLYRSGAIGPDFPQLYASLMDFIECTTFLRAGEYDRGMAMLEEAVRITREKGMGARVLTGLSNIAMEAWLWDDEPRFQAAIAELREGLLPGFERAWSFFLASACGLPSEGPTGYELPSVRAFAFLFAAARAPAADRARLAAAAVAESDGSSDIAVQVFTRIALAEFDRERRARARREAVALAAQIDIPEFRCAVEAYAADEADLGVLARFVGRRLRVRAETTNGVRIELLAGRVTRKGEPVALSPKELALMTLLASARGRLGRESICDALWPELETDAAARSMKVIVHRLRKKLGDDCVQFVRNAYLVGAGVTIDLPEAEAVVRTASRHGSLSAAEVSGLEAIVEAIEGRVAEHLLAFDWYVGLDHRLRELARSASLLLVRSALRQKLPERAVTIARPLVERDPADEEACKALLQAYATGGHAAAARLAIETFERQVLEAGDELAARRIRSFYTDLVSAPAIASVK